MSSLILNNHIPYSILNPKQDLHFDPLRVFGSTCFVHDFTSGRNELSAQVSKMYLQVDPMYKLKNIYKT